jgi:PAS domain S-box-containing protein
LRWGRGAASIGARAKEVGIDPRPADPGSEGTDESARVGFLADALSDSRRREELLVEAQQIAGVGSWEWDLAKRSSTWSPELYRIFGLDPEGGEPSYEAFLDSIHPADRTMVERTVRAALSGGAFSVVHRIVRPDGEERLVICRGKVFFDLDRSPVRMVGATLDMTDYQRTGAELRTRHAQLSEAEELTGTGVFEWDVRSDAVTWTDGLCRLYGREADDFPRTFAGYLELVHPEDRDQRRDQIESALASEDIITDVTRVVRADGAERWIRSRLRVIRDADGRPVRVIGACLDVTDLGGETPGADQR